jgi:hypothetical protein
MQRLIALATVVAMFAFASPALAQDSATDAYGGQPGILGEIETVEPGDDGTSTTPTPPADTPVARSADTLPFTGFDAFLMGAGGIALLSIGLAMRRLGRVRA